MGGESIGSRIVSNVSSCRHRCVDCRLFLSYTCARQVHEAGRDIGTSDIFVPIVGSRHFAIFKNDLPTIVRMERYLPLIGTCCPRLLVVPLVGTCHWRSLTNTKIGYDRLCQAVIDGHADPETRLQLVACALIGQELLQPILYILKKVQ